MNLTDKESEVLQQTAALVPAYNAGAHLQGVIDDIKQVMPAERIIVVDDGSADNTADIARAAGVVVVVHDPNQGKGVALKSGVDKARELGYEFVIALDADGQHAPSEIPRFIRRQAETGADMIVGNRMADTKDMPAERIFANKATSAVVSAFARAKIPDSQNGYRMMRTSLVGDMKLETKRYDTESEIIIKAGRSGAKITDVPVSTIYGDEVSSINPFVDTLRFFRLMYKSLFW